MCPVIDLKIKYWPGVDRTLTELKTCACFQAYATVVSAAEGNNPDSDNYGKVEEVKQYPFITLYTSVSSVTLFQHFITLL